jgi:bromodomain and PHD finger-containing protein 1
MIRNCLLYNDKETIFYKMGVKMKEQGLIIFRQARKELERSGMIEAPIADGEIVKQIDGELKEILSYPMSLETLKKLEELMGKTNTIKHHLTKGKRVKMIKYEIIKMKKKLKVKGMSDGSDEESENDQEEKDLDMSNLLKTPDSKKQQSDSLGSSLQIPSLNISPLSASAGVNRR